MDDTRDTQFGSGMNEERGSAPSGNSGSGQQSGDLDRNTCYVCGRKLGWTSRRRRHTCRRCRNKVCNDCSRKRRMIEIKIGQSQNDDQSDNDGYDDDGQTGGGNNDDGNSKSRSKSLRRGNKGGNKKNGSKNGMTNNGPIIEEGGYVSGERASGNQQSQSGGASEGAEYQQHQHHHGQQSGSSGSSSGSSSSSGGSKSGHQGSQQQVIYRLERVCDTCCKNNERNVLIKERLRDLRLKFNKHNKGTYVVKVDRNSKEYCQMGLINYCKIVEIDGSNCEQLSSHAIAHKLNTNPLPFTITLDYTV